MNSPAPKPPSMFAVPKPPSPVPAGGKPKAEEPAPKPARGRSVALLGLPSSGKTSYLYALTHTSARGRHRWIIGLHTKEFERLTGDPNERQEGTPVGEFRPARLFEMSRPWLGALGLRRGPGPAREVVIPEIAGETVERYALGRELKDAERTAVGKLKAYLHHSDEVLFLVGIDGAQGTGRLRPESVEAAMLGSVKALRTVLKDMQDGRERDEPIFVSLLVTKRDRLRGTPMDRVRLRSAESALARLARRPGFRWLASEGLLVDGGDEAVFGVNDVCGHARARHDLGVQEAAAADFLRCHAPRAAADLAELAAQPGISVRLLTIAPYGTPSLDASGAAVFPPVTKITPSLVFESLEDLVERRFRRQARTRIAWLTAAVAAALLVAVAFGPAWTWHFRGKAQQAIDARRWPDAGRMLARVAVVPWWRVEIAAPARAAGDKSLIGQVLQELEEANQREQFKPVVAELERMRDRVDPAGVEERRSDGADKLVKYIDGEAGEPDKRVTLDEAAVTQVITALERTSEQRVKEFKWADFKDRCERLDERLKGGTITFPGEAQGAKGRLEKALKRGISRAELMSLTGQPRSDELLGRKRLAVSLGEFLKLGELSSARDDKVKNALLGNSSSEERRIEDQQEALEQLKRLKGDLEQFATTPRQAVPRLEPEWALKDRDVGVIKDVGARWKLVLSLEEVDPKVRGSDNAQQSAELWKSIGEEDRKISVLGPDGEWADIDFKAVVDSQDGKVSQALDALADRILEMPDGDQKKRLDEAESRIRIKVGMKDVLDELQDALRKALESFDRGPGSGGAEGEPRAAQRAFEAAREKDAARLCKRLSSDDSELAKSFARLASKDPEAVATMLDQLGTKGKPGSVVKEEDVDRAIEGIFRKVDWGKLFGAAGLEKLACAGLGESSGRLGEERARFFGERLEESVRTIVDGAGDARKVGQSLRVALALDAARAAVGSCGESGGGAAKQTPKLPTEIARELRKAFVSTKGGIDAALWVSTLLKCEEVEGAQECQAARKHSELITKYRLLPVWDADKGAVVCYVGERELTRVDLDLPAMDGKLIKVQQLQLNHEDLSKSLKELGLRLPTDSEWSLIEGDPRFLGLDKDGVRELVTTDDGGGRVRGESFAGPGGTDDDDLRDVGGRAALDPLPEQIQPK